MRRPEPQRPVVVDVNVLVAAIVRGNAPFRSWPSPPPTTDNPAADVLGVLNDGVEFSLWLSPHVLRNVHRVLTEGYQRTDAAEYLEVLVEIADASGGDVVEPHERVSDCPDHEDNRILELALAAGAAIVVSDDADLLALSPWRGIPIITSREFAGRVDAMRRAARRRR